MSESWHTSLHIAAQYGSIDAIRRLLRGLLDDMLLLMPNSKLSHTLASVFQQKLSDFPRDQSGNTPLHTACVHGQTDVVQFLTREIGCDPKIANSEGLSCLHLAVQHGHLPLVKHLVEELLSDEDEHRWSHMYLAAGGGHLDILQYLIEEKGADPGFVNSRKWKTTNFTLIPGMSLVHTASYGGHLHVVRYLVEHHGCDPSCKDGKGFTPLHLACQQGHMDIVSYLITEAHCDPNCTTSDGRTCLHVASSRGKLDVIKNLTENHNCQVKRDSNGNTALHYAAFCGRLEVVKYLAEELNYSVNSVDSFNRTPLHHASESGHLDVVEYLVENCCSNPLCLDKEEGTPLHMAAAKGRLNVVKYFTAKCHSDPEVTTVHGNTPLFYAAYFGHLEVVRYLIEDMNCDSTRRGQLERTPLHNACEKGQLTIVMFLVEIANCDPMCLGKHNQTPLHLAAAKGHLKVAKYLVTRKSDPRIVDGNGNSPLHFAAQNGHLEVVKFLVEDLKCNPGSKSHHERTPLHHASENGHLNVVKYLVEAHSCNPDDYDVTPLHRAAAKCQLEIIRYFLLTCNCEPQAKTSSGNTPLHYAAFNGHLEAVKLLIEELHCDPNVANNLRLQPLHCAIGLGHAGISVYLIGKKGIDVTATAVYDCSTTNPLRLAVDSGDLEIVKCLTSTHRLDPYMQPDRKKLEAAASNDMLDYFENYVDPLDKAAIAGDMKSVKRYVEVEEWCPKRFDRHGNNLLHNAAQNGQLKVVEYLTGLNKDPINELEVLCDPLLSNKGGLRAHDLASRKGYEDVVSYLLRATNHHTVSQEDVLSPSLNILVMGNTGSGKSTLIKALSTEGGVWGWIMKVRNVSLRTCGVVRTTLHSQVFGRVNMYDFAGHREYYASHEMILQQTSRPLVLLTVDISLSLPEIEKEVRYWLSILSNSSKAVNVILVGSHADQVKNEEKRKIEEAVTKLMADECIPKFHGFINCDCRYSTSSNLSLLRQKLNSVCKSICVLLAHHESVSSNRLCASLMNLLYHDNTMLPDEVTTTVGKLCMKIRQLESQNPALVSLTNQDKLVKTCRSLSLNGHLLFLPHDLRADQSLLVLNEEVILSQVHACLGEIKQLVNGFGVLKEITLKSILAKSLKNAMEPDLAIQYLLFAQFCTKIAADQLISPPDNIAGDVYYFFPNLALALRPADLLPITEHTYPHLYTWCLKCSYDRQFFTPRFLHTLFIQLIKCNRDAASTEYSIWKNGILLVHNNGKCVIEVSDQSTRVCVTMQCVKERESHFVQQRSALISLIKSLTTKMCPNLQVAECLLLPHNSYPPRVTTEIPIAKVAISAVNMDRMVSYKEGDGDTPKHVLTKDLLLFDSIYAIEKHILQDIFSPAHSHEVVPLTTVSSICNAIASDCKELSEAIEGAAYGLTKSQLCDRIIQYSIFSAEATINVSLPCIEVRYFIYCMFVLLLGTGIVEFWISTFYIS